MKKSSKKSRSNGAQTVQSHLTLVGYVRQSLQDFVITQGMLALQQVLREEQEALCGPAHEKGAPDEAKRWGTTRGRLAFGGQRITAERPRVRKCGKEVTLPSWEEFAAEDPLNEKTYEQMVLGVSTRVTMIGAWTNCRLSLRVMEQARAPRAVDSRQRRRSKLTNGSAAHSLTCHLWPL